MFPNPQDALPLPERPDLEQYRKRAKELLRAAKSPYRNALHEWSSNWIASLVSAADPNARMRMETRVRDVAGFAAARMSAHSSLSDAQFVIATAHGFPSWPKFSRHLRSLCETDSAEGQFEAAADAIVDGDIERLSELLRANPKLVHRRSTREHNGTLLHYVSANGVESYRQKTPKNIVDIARVLLAFGAEVDAGADVYGSCCTTLGLVATSVHPKKAGVQSSLMQLLLDHGASLERPGLAGRDTPLVLACFHNGQPDAAHFLADRGAPLNLESAAGVGRIELVKSFFDQNGQLLSSASRPQLQNGFLWACECGHTDVALLLLDRGADPLDPGTTGAPALHWAAGAADLTLVRFFIERGSPLELTNQWGGTVLEHAGHAFEHGPDRLDLVPVFELLLAAGAEIRGSWLTWLDSVTNRSTEDKQNLAAVLRRYGAVD